MTELDRKAADFVRAAKCLARGGNVGQALDIGHRERASPATLEWLRTKSASPAGSLDGDGWAADLADQDGVTARFVESLRPRSVLLRFAELAEQQELRQRVVVMPSLAAGLVDEGQPIAAVFAPFEPTTIEPRKAAALVALSRELVEATDRVSFQRLRSELQRAATFALDAAWHAVVTTDAPEPIAFNGADPAATIRAMFQTVATTGGERVMLAAAPDIAARLTTFTAVDLAPRVFPGMTLAGGDLWGAPCLVTNALPNGRLVAVDAAAFAAAPVAIDIDLARAASIQMRSDPESGATEVISLFGSGLVALRIVARFGLDRIRAGGVAIADLGGG